MIKRSIPKKLIPVEHLTEDYTVGASGIDVTSLLFSNNFVWILDTLFLWNLFGSAMRYAFAPEMLLYTDTQFSTECPLVEEQIPAAALSLLDIKSPVLIQL